jgi:lysophospholipase L1-like esterase
MNRLLLLILPAVVAVGALALLTGQDDGGPGAEALPAHVRLVALGDSLATGTGAATGYPAELAELIRTDAGSQVEVVNLAVDGWTTADLLGALQTDEVMREEIGRAHVVTVGIGGNDLLRARLAYELGRCGGPDGLACLEQAVVDIEEGLDEILAAITDLAPADARVRTMDLYHPFVAEDARRGNLELLLPILDAVNQAIHEVAGRHRVPVAEVNAAFNGPDGTDDPVEAGLISEDRRHPSDAGHRLIAERAAELGWER